MVDRGETTYLAENFQTVIGVMSSFCGIGVTAVVVDEVFQSPLFHVYKYGIWKEG